MRRSSHCEGEEELGEQSQLERCSNVKIKTNESGMSDASCASFRFLVRSEQGRRIEGFCGYKRKTFSFKME